MTALHEHKLPAGYTMFARYAFPPNELGYCGPADSEVLLRGDNPSEVADNAKEFDGAWPYLHTIAEAAGIPDPLDVEVVRSYWIGGPLLDRVDATALVQTLRRAFTGQATGLLGHLARPQGALAHHSFHVFVVYPWVRFLDREPTIALKVLQDCRIRWGAVESVDDEHATVTARPLTFSDGTLGLGEPRLEQVRWSKNGVALIGRPTPGEVVAAHWEWACGVLTDDECAALADATRTTLNLVNTDREERKE
ncbi:DUF6390 family protein [Mycobacterium sp. 1274761.0]|uniref:DUF6390 family protein n=1 Tax=Mycobacterium sp. 1274761.0 TaxID=1834077 RepID=UPI0007FE28A6|nr:DUF6390 family protein [Mycobacterium sp. 1274761.0]OBK71338.1 hypothetical protein A5651_18635 [Mycobacterium sp. 1274761.0]